MRFGETTQRSSFRKSLLLTWVVCVCLCLSAGIKCVSVSLQSEWIINHFAVWQRQHREMGRSRDGSQTWQRMHIWLVSNIKTARGEVPQKLSWLFWCVTNVLGSYKFKSLQLLLKTKTILLFSHFKCSSIQYVLWFLMQAIKKQSQYRTTIKLYWW